MCLEGKKWRIEHHLSDESVFMTNFHVINYRSEINSTSTILDDEEDRDGKTKVSKSFKYKFRWFRVYIRTLLTT